MRQGSVWCKNAGLVDRGNLEAQTDAVELLAQVAHGLQCAVAAHGSHGLQHLQQVLALKSERQTMSGAGDIAIGAQERRFQFDGGA